MDILNVVGNIFLEQSEFWWFAFLFLFGWIWTVKVDNVDTYMAAYINDLQDCKVDTDEVPILQNILGGSLFGTWSQSDANKGLAALVFDNGVVAPVVGETINGVDGTGKVMYFTLSGGAWGGTAAGTVYLGAVTGTFIDNETIAGSVAAVFDVNGDKFIGAINDPCNNDDTGDWTQDGDSLNFNAGGFYEFATSANDKTAWKTGSSLTAGKLYKVEIELKDGTAFPTDLRIYFRAGLGGVAQYGPDINTGGAFVKYTWTFEADATTVTGRAGVRAVTSLGGGDIEIRRLSCYEITPCCTVADSKAWDGDEWTKENGLDLYREHWDGGTNTKEGSFYALKCVPDADNIYINWRYDLRNENEHRAKFYGRTAIMGMWVKTSTPNHFRICMYEGGPGASVYSDYHAGDGNWEWLEVPITYITTGTFLYNQWRFYQPPNVDGSTIVYISQPMLIFCPAIDGIIGEGNYSPKLQEFIYTKVPILSMAYDNTVNWSDFAFRDLNIEADSDAMLPKGAKAIRVHTGIKDTGSGAASNVHLCLRSDAVFLTMSYVNSVAGKASNIESHNLGIQECDQYGDVDIHLDASGAGANLDVIMFEYHGVQVI